MTNKTNTLPSLEESLNEINQLIQKMEKNDLTLEQSLNHFERGVTLIKHSQKILEEAEQKVQILLQNNGKEELANFSITEEEPEKNEPDKN